MEIRPNYYDKFKCIADKCRHNCCIGWEIDIDESTLEKYKKETGEKLLKSISLKPTPHFILGEDERCPFLNKDNLCELILEGGDNMLCQICKGHPRFYCDVFGITEKGLGLCCEAAAEIILRGNEKFSLVGDCKLPNDDFFRERDEIFSVLQNRQKPINDRIAELLCKTHVSIPLTEINWIEVYKNLERLDNSWSAYLDSIDNINDYIPCSLETCCEQLLCYFIYRHLSGGLDDFLFAERIQFAVLSCYIIVSLCKSKTADEFCEISRLYSSEIEYSDENIDILLDLLNKYNENNK